PEEMVRLVSEQDPERPSVAIERVESVSLDDGTTTTVTAETVSLTRDGSPALLRRRLSGTLDEILLKALRKEPEQRYASVAALAKSVGAARRCLDGNSGRRDVDDRARWGRPISCAACRARVTRSKRPRSRARRRVAVGGGRRSDSRRALVGLRRDGDVRDQRR